VIGALSAAVVSPASAEQEISFYTGFQEAAHSRVYVDDPGGVGTTDFLVGWDGRSFETPPYYGFRYTYWRNDRFGFGVEFNHAKTYAPDDIMAANGFSSLEFTDGLNIITVNAFRRWKDLDWSVTPYVGGGLGISVPHVDVETAGGKTFEYQLTGPALMLAAGASYDLSDRWAVFGEYKFTYSVNQAELASGGTLDTDIVTNALNIGVTYKF
jgi:lipid A oxidase